MIDERASPCFFLFIQEVMERKTRIYMKICRWLFFLHLHDFLINVIYCRGYLSCIIEFNFKCICAGVRSFNLLAGVQITDGIWNVTMGSVGDTQVIWGNLLANCLDDCGYNIARSISSCHSFYSIHYESLSYMHDVI